MPKEKVTAYSFTSVISSFLKNTQEISIKIWGITDLFQIMLWVNDFDTDYIYKLLLSLLLYFMLVFHTISNWRYFHWSLCNRKSPQVSRTLLSILADFNSSVVWMVSILLLISSSSSLFPRFWIIVSRTPTMIGITVTLIIHTFFSSLARSRYLSSWSPSNAITSWSIGTAKSTFHRFCFFLFFSFFFPSFFFFFFFSFITQSVYLAGIIIIIWSYTN